MIPSTGAIFTEEETQSLSYASRDLHFAGTGFHLGSVNREVEEKEKEREEEGVDYVAR